MERDAVSRRLKAARWLAGGLNEKGKATPLTPEQLAEREPLVRNRISANRLYEIEQERVDAREMELEKIAEALRVPATFFLADVPLAESATAATLDVASRQLAETTEIVRQLLSALAHRNPGTRDTLDADLRDALDRAVPGWAAVSGRGSAGDDAGERDEAPASSADAARPMKGLTPPRAYRPPRPGSTPSHKEPRADTETDVQPPAEEAPPESGRSKRTR